MISFPTGDILTVRDRLGVEGRSLTASEFQKERKETAIRDKVKRREESQAGHCKEMDLVENFSCEGLLWEEDVTSFLTGGRKPEFLEWAWRREEGLEEPIVHGLGLPEMTLWLGPSVHLKLTPLFFIVVFQSRGHLLNCPGH